MNKDIKAYNDSLPADRTPICELLLQEIQRALPDVENKIWHGAPVWFIEGNPIVGYWNRKNFVSLLFWSGQSFEESKLIPEGKFKTAEARYTNPDQINKKDLARWLEKSRNIQWDYKNIVRRRGILERLK